MPAKKKSKTTARRKTTSRKTASRHKPARKWSQRVTEHSDAMTLEKGVFTKRSGRAIALSVKRSAERSNPRKSSPYRSSMTMLTFYANRCGKNLTVAQKKKLQDAKGELRKLFGKEKAA
jgi:hypothetical protein